MAGVPKLTVRAGRRVSGAGGAGAALAKKGRARYCLAPMEACSPWGGQGSRGPACRPQRVRDDPAPHGSAPPTLTATRAAVPISVLAAEAPLDQHNLPSVLAHQDPDLDRPGAVAVGAVARPPAITSRLVPASKVRGSSPKGPVSPGTATQTVPPLGSTATAPIIGTSWPVARVFPAWSSFAASLRTLPRLPAAASSKTVASDTHPRLMTPRSSNIRPHPNPGVGMGATASPFHNTGVATVLYLPPDPGTYVKADCTQHAWSQPLCCRLDASRVIVPRVVDPSPHRIGNHALGREGPQDGGNIL